MGLTRRRFIHNVVGASALSLIPSGPPTQIHKFPEITNNNPKFKAIAFDAFPIFDPRPVFEVATRVVGAKGPEFVNLWRTKQFEYTWLRTLNQRYTDFWTVTFDAMRFVEKSIQVKLSDGERDTIMNAYLQIQTWPDAPEALHALKESGVRMAFLSNFTHAMLSAGINNSRLEGIFEFLLSTDNAQRFKPDFQAYQLGIDAFKLRKEEILFVAFAGWDAAGAKSFGYPTYWVNRLNSPSEELGIQSDWAGRNLNDLTNFVLS